MAEHTRGPWGIRKDEYSYSIECSNTGADIGYIWSETDAHLMAAAPDLLAALEGIQDDWGCCCRYPGNGTHESRCRAVTAAIAKAKGEGM